MMEKEKENCENGYWTKKEMLDEVSYCEEMLEPYLRKEMPLVDPLDGHYRQCRLLLPILLDSLCNECDDDLKSVKKKDKKKRKKIEKEKKFYAKKLSKYKKALLKLEGRKSIDKEIAETMQLINKGIDESKS